MFIGSIPFRICYFLSAMGPVYVLLLIEFYLYHILEGYSIMLIVFAFFGCLFAFLTSICIKWKMTDISNNYRRSDALSHVDVKFTNEYNTGIRDFLLGFVFMFISINMPKNDPIIIVSTILIYQIIILLYYFTSSDFFPNLTLQLMGYSYIVAKNNEYTYYVFCKTGMKNKLIGNNGKITIFGDSKFNKIGLFVEAGEKNGA